jgi:hypothetical protein
MSTLDSLLLLQTRSLSAPVSWDSAEGAAVFKKGTAGVGGLIDINEGLLPHKDKKAIAVLNSWWAGGYFVAGDEVIGFIYNPLIVKPLVGGQMVENLSLINVTTGKHYNGNKTYPVPKIAESGGKISIVTETGSITGDFDDLHAAGKMDGGSFDVHLRASSPAIYNGGTGVYPLCGLRSYQYSLPVLATRGTVTMDGKTYKLDGNSWFDRQWGILDPKSGMPKWTWFGINLVDGTALSVWHIFDKAIGKNRAFATILHNDGSQTVAAAICAPDAAYAWKSPQTKNLYYLKWTIDIPQLDTTLEIVSTEKDQEFTMAAMGGGYEGVSNVTGTFQGKEVAGAARLEMLGSCE